MSTSGSSADTTITLPRVIAASRERVYAAFTTPELARQWWAGPGWTHTDLILDAHPGGVWRFHLREDTSGETFESEGEYLEAVEPERLCWTNRWTDAGASRHTTVTVTFTEVDGGTAVHILHEFLPDASTRDQHQGGWGGSLDQLTELLQAAS